VAALGSYSPARRPHPRRSRWFACANLGAESLARIATALREQITGDRRAHEPRRRCLNLENVVVVISTGWMCVLEGGRLPARHRRSPAARHEMGPVHRGRAA
jgi:hypothetical protein